MKDTKFKHLIKHGTNVVWFSAVSNAKEENKITFSVMCISFMQLAFILPGGKYKF